MKREYIKRIFILMILPLLLCLTVPAYAAEAPKDYIIKGMPDYTLERQKREFSNLKIRSPKPESKGFDETTYEGNIVFTRYNFKGAKDATPSKVQAMRYYRSAVQKLGGEVLWVHDTEQYLHASFTRNDKQYYMGVTAGSTGRTTPANYIEVTILELAELDYDVEIIDADTILYQLETEGFITLYINFDTGKATLKPDAAEVIDEIVTALKSKTDLKVKLEGHTDNVGNAAANKKLSDDRANAVMNAIVAKGIDKARLSAEGFGLEKPIADNNTQEGRAKNRRVELVKQ